MCVVASKLESDLRGLPHSEGLTHGDHPRLEQCSSTKLTPCVAHAGPSWFPSFLKVLDTAIRLALWIMFCTRPCSLTNYDMAEILLFCNAVIYAVFNNCVPL